MDPLLFYDVSELRLTSKTKIVGTTIVQGPWLIVIYF